MSAVCVHCDSTYKSIGTTSADSVLVQVYVEYVPGEFRLTITYLGNETLPYNAPPHSSLKVVRYTAVSSIICQGSNVRGP